MKNRVAADVAGHERPMFRRRAIIVSRHPMQTADDRILAGGLCPLSFANRRISCLVVREPKGSADPGRNPLRSASEGSPQLVKYPGARAALVLRHPFRSHPGDQRVEIADGGTAHGVGSGDNDSQSPLHLLEKFDRTHLGVEVETVGDRAPRLLPVKDRAKPPRGAASTAPVAGGKRCGGRRHRHLPRVRRN